MNTIFRNSLLGSIVCLLFSCSFSFGQSEQRTWTSANGKFEIEAVLESSDDKSVKLKKSNGKVVEVPLAKLCKDDRKYLKEAAKRAEDERKQIEFEKLEASKFDVLGVFRIGTSDEGMSWSKIESIPKTSGKMIRSECVKEGSAENVQLMLIAQEISGEKTRADYAKTLSDGLIEGHEEEGHRNIKSSGMQRDGRRKDQFICDSSSQLPNGVTMYSVVRVKYAKTALVILAFAETAERAMKLSEVIETAKQPKGDEFESALDDFRRFAVPWLGFSIEPPPLDMGLMSKDETSIRLQSPGGTYIFVRAVNATDDADIDKTWKIMQRMAIAPTVKVDDEGSAKVNGVEARYKSYFHKALGDKLWGTTWLVRGEGKMYMVTGMCLESKKESDGKSLLKAIRGIKPLP